jgi:hypothetical protein
MIRKLISILLTITILSTCKNDKSNIYIDYLRGFHQSIQILEYNNSKIFKEFLYYKFLAPEKVEFYCEQATFIHDLKKELFFLIDSIENDKSNIAVDSLLNLKTLDNILYKSIKLKNEEIKNIYSRIEHFIDKSISFFIKTDKSYDSATIKEIKKLLDIKKLNNINIFQSKPVVVAELLACFEKIKYDILIIETSILKHLFNHIDGSYDNFRFIGPFILPNSLTLPKGYPYRAEIFLAAYDTNSSITYEVDGKKYELASGSGRYKFRVTEKPGLYLKNGNFMIKSPYTGEIQKIPFKIEYEVLNRN